jgi:hypothetical protein
MIAPMTIEIPGSTLMHRQSKIAGLIGRGIATAGWRFPPPDAPPCRPPLYRYGPDLALPDQPARFSD